MAPSLDKRKETHYYAFTMALNLPPRTCKLPGCRAEFVPKRRNQIYCKPQCRALHWWQRENGIDRFNKPEFAEEISQWMAKVGYRNKTFVAIRKAVCSRIAQRQTPHGPGKKKR